MPPFPARVAALLACVAAWPASPLRPLTPPPPLPPLTPLINARLVTVEQADPLRSARAPRTVDISTDGRYVAFESWARLVPADKDDHPDIYVLDRETGLITLESDGLEDRENSHPRISGNGQRVVFESRVVLISGEARVDIALRDRAASSVRLLTGSPETSPLEWSRQADIGDDGTVVVFASTSTSLVPGTDANGTREDVYAMQLATGAIERISVTTAGVQPAVGASNLPTVSADGRYVAFTSTAALAGEPSSSLPADPPNRVFLRDRKTGTTNLVSRPIRGSRIAGESGAPSMSADGRFITYSSDASNIVSDDGNQGRDIFLFDRDSMSNTLVSRADGGGAPNGVSLGSVISSDGRFIVFQSDASNLTCTAARCSARERDINLLWDVFVFDRLTRKIVRVSEDELGGWMEWSAGPAIDGAGQVIAFSSRHPTDALDQRHDLDLFVSRR